ncbi:hypothetical protein ACHAW6_001832 [Cyclotella cf. meneghiniana]
MLGSNVGDRLGDFVGDELGERVGLRVGNRLGDNVGETLGESVGLTVGEKLGDLVGDTLGGSVGFSVGERLGCELGLSEGDSEGCSDGLIDGECDGSALGETDGVIEGAKEGLREGATEGCVEGKELIDGDIEGDAEQCWYDDMSRFNVDWPHVLPRSSNAAIMSCSSNSKRVELLNRQRQPSGSVKSTHQRFSIEIDSIKNIPSKSTIHQALASLVCEKVDKSPSIASFAYLTTASIILVVLENSVEDCFAYLPRATLTPEEMTSTSNIWICCPVVDWIFSFLAIG